MSFMKKLKGLADDFKGLMGDEDKDKKKDEPKQDISHHDSHRGASDTYYGQPQEAYGSHQQPAFGQQPGHSPQPQHQYGGPPPPQAHDGPPASGPQLPPGWLQQWDTNSQRYYYLEQATGRSQWEPPAMHGPPGDQQRGYGVPPASMTSYGQHGHSAQGYPPPTGLAYSGGEKKSNKGGMLAAGAGGLALGGLAGAALAHDSDSDDGHHASGGYEAPPGAGYGGGHGQDRGYGYGAPPASDQQALEHNSDVSSSQRESLEEAREDYEEAQKEAADSDASSSDHEEAREAEEDYREEVEEAQEEAYDD